MDLCWPFSFVVVFSSSLTWYGGEAGKLSQTQIQVPEKEQRFKMGFAPSDQGEGGE